MEYAFTNTANILVRMNNPSPHIATEAARLSACYKRWKQAAPDERRNQAMLADIMGWASQGTVSQYMTGRLELNLEALMKFAAVLDFNPRDISPRLAAEYLAAEPEDVTMMAGARMKLDQSPQPRLLPVIGCVQAGHFCEAVDLFEVGAVSEWMEAYGPAGARAYVLRVEGLSMDPDFRPGDKVVIDPDAQWSSGDFIVAKRIADQAVTLKQIRSEGDHFYLYATNPDWPERIIRMTEEWHICGRVRRKIVEY